MGKFWKLTFILNWCILSLVTGDLKSSNLAIPSSVVRECLGPISGWVSMALVLETWMNKSLSTKSHPSLNWLRSLTDLRHVGSPQCQSKLSFLPPKLYRFVYTCVLLCRSFTQSSLEMTCLKLSRIPIQWTRTNWIPTRCHEIYVSYLSHSAQLCVIVLMSICTSSGLPPDHLRWAILWHIWAKGKSHLFWQELQPA